MSDTDRYSRSQMVLHWLTLLALLVSFFTREGMAAAWRELMRSAEPFVSPGPTVHSITGLLILLVVLARLVLRLVKGAPAAEARWPAWMKTASAAVHGLLYVVLIAMPVTGAMAWLFGIKGAAGLHGPLFTALLVLVAAHIGAALYHQFVLKDKLLARMR